MIDNTQMPPQTSLSPNVMNEPTRTEYVVMKVDYTPLVMISAADVDKILTVSRE